MSSSQKSNERNAEVVTFFYHIFTHRIRSGLSQIEARKEACDAVSLRYNISKGRLLNIISSHKHFDDANKAAFRSNAENLISELDVINKALQEEMDRNAHLISLLKECAYDNR